MARFSEKFAERRKGNAAAWAAFDMPVSVGAAGSLYQTIREGSGRSIFTIGYEKRDGDEFISRLCDAGINVLIDVRDKPISRKPDFRETALKALCENASIQYESWKELGSTETQRDELKNTGDFKHFASEFRRYAKRDRNEVICRLANRIKTEKLSFALVCYERCHNECHRSVIAELLADKIDFGIIAIL